MSPRPGRPLLLAVAALAACDSTLPWSSAPGAVPRGLALTPASLTFTGEVGVSTYPAPRTQTIAVGGLAPGVLLVPTAPAPGGPIELIAAWDSTVSVTVRQANDVGPGTFEELVTLRACRIGTGCWPLEGVAIGVRYVVAGATLSFTPSSLEFEQLVGGPPPPPRTIDLHGRPEDGPWYAWAEDAPWLDVQPGSGATTPSLVTASPSGSPDFPSTSSGSIRFTRRGIGFAVPVRRIARAPATTVTAAPLVFEVRERDAFVAERPVVALATEEDVPVQFTISVSYGEAGVPAWLSVPAYATGPGSFPVGLATTDLPVGTYTATVRVRDPWGTSDVRLPATLRISPALLSPSPARLAFAVDATTTPPDAVASFTLTSAASATAWTASADVPWLAVTPRSGTAASGAPSVVIASVVASGLASLVPGVHEGNVEIVSGDDQGSSVVRVAASLDLRLPRVEGVGPGVDVAGALRDVVVVGPWLGTATGVLFGDTPAAATTPGGWSAMYAAPPALPPGTYRVTVPTAMGVSLGSGTYRIAAPHDPTAIAFPSPGAKSRVWYDDATRELWAVNAGAGALERFRGSAGWAHEALPLARLQDALPTPDGAHVLTCSRGGLELVDASTFAPAPTQPTDLSQADWSTVSGHLAVLADGWAVLLQDPRPPDCVGCDPLYYVLDPRAEVVRLGFWFRWDAVRATVPVRTGQGFYALAEDRAGLYQWQRGWVSQTGEPYTGFGAWPLSFAADQVAADRDGVRTLAVRDGTTVPGDSDLRDWATHTRLPGKLPSTTAAATLTQDGSRAIAFDGVSRTVRTFDLAAPPDPATGIFVEIGTGVAPAGDPGANVVLALSADDRILFVAGDERIAVVPLP